MFLCVVRTASMVRVLLVSSFWLWPVCWFCNPFCMLMLVSQNVGNKNYLIIGKKKTCKMSSKIDLIDPCMCYFFFLMNLVLLVTDSNFDLLALIHELTLI